MALHRVFVYGSLKRGERNHELLAAARFVGPGRTPPRFTLVELLAHGGYPAMVEGGKTAIEGEVWEVDDATLAALDALEEHPGFYRRVQLELADGAKTLTYVLPKNLAAGAPVVDSGCWTEGDREEG